MQTKNGENGKDKCEHYKKKIYTDDNVLNCINKNFISLKDGDIKKHNEHLRKIIIEGLIPLMRNDNLFNVIYQNINYSGSFFKGTKVNKPDEYDLNLILRLPVDYKTLQVDEKHKYFGYVKIKIKEESKSQKWQEHSKILDKWLNSDGYLNQDEFHRWMQKVMTLTFNQLKKVGKFFELNVNDKKYILKPFSTCGPAFTVFIVKSNDLDATEEVMSIDLAPCLEFQDVVLKKYRVIKDMVPKFLVVAKASEENVEAGNVLWRLSFYEQERLILLKSEAGKMKPIIRMIKKFRDNKAWKKLASYYIETLALHELLAREKDNDFFRAPKTGLFMHMLYKFWEALEAKNLPYFWNQHHNLLGKLDSMAISNYANQLKAILANIEKNISNNKFVIADQILTVSEGENLRQLITRGLCDDAEENVIEKRQLRATSEPAQSIATTSRTDSSKKCDVDRRIDQLCDNLYEFSKAKHALSQEQLRKIKEACRKFLETRENQDIDRRIDQLCDNLHEYSKAKHAMSQEKLRKIKEACRQFLDTRENQDLMYSGF